MAGKDGRIIAAQHDPSLRGGLPESLDDLADPGIPVGHHGLDEDRVEGPVCREKSSERLLWSTVSAESAANSAVDPWKGYHLPVELSPAPPV